MSALTSKFFWADTIERAVKTFAQTLLALLGADAVNVFTINWGDRLSVAAFAVIASILTSVASAGSGNSASLVVDAKPKE